MKPRNLLFVFTLLFISSLFLAAQNHTVIMLPKWKTTSATQVINGSNYVIPGYTKYHGDRIKNSDQVKSTNTSPYQFPVMSPLIIYAKASEGSEITWNIDSESVRVIGYPEGSEFISGEHIRTPVISGSTTVEVENPYIIKEEGNRASRKEQLKSNWKSYRNQMFVKKNFYTMQSQGGSSSKTNLYDAKFKPSGNAYIIVMATKPGNCHVVATSNKGDANKYSTAVAHIGFIETNLLLTKAAPPPSRNLDYTLVVSGGPKYSPINIEPGKSNSADYQIYITNKGRNTIEPSQVLLKVEAEGSWSSDEYLAVLKRELKPGETTPAIDVSLSIIYNNVPGNIGVLEAKARILYPTSPESGKSCDLDISYIKEPEITVPKQLAGIGTRLSNQSNRYILYLENTSPDGNAVLEIKSMTGVRNPYYNKLIKGGTSANTFTVNSSGNIIVKYQLFSNDKPVGSVRTITITQ